MPQYEELYGRFAGSGFTTNKEKYLHFTPEQLDALVDGFLAGGRVG